MRGDILHWRGTVCPSVDCPVGHCTLVQNVRGYIVHYSAKCPGGQILGGTLYTMTPGPMFQASILTALVDSLNPNRQKHV